ncbi:MAG: hypothetical protein KL787_05620 [Taibaiella sp.]|nr:hypothetical protein [Taibaiella sp.]
MDAAFSQEHKLENNEPIAHISFQDQAAVSADLIAAVPGTEYLVSLNYERVGKGFKNNSLPVSFSGIERMSARVDGTLFRSSVLFGAEYAYLVQNSMYTSGNQAKWGFNLKTNWKRWPNVSFSYKPFTSVRSPYDTFNIPQKEMIGNLLSGKINYQYKGRNRDIFRATLMLNQSTSLMDSIRFQSSMLQVNFSYIHPVYSLMVAFGANNMESDYYESAHPIYNQNQFVLLQGNYKITEGLSVSMGGDVAKSKIGISKYGFNAASSYTFEKIPLSIRLSGRYSSFILEEFSPWKKIYSAGLDVSYRLFTKLD